jgi:cell division septum initiation protein DivIVA
MFGSTGHARGVLLVTMLVTTFVGCTSSSDVRDLQSRVDALESQMTSLESTVARDEKALADAQRAVDAAEQAAEAAATAATRVTNKFASVCDGASQYSHYYLSNGAPSDFAAWFNEFCH